MTSTVSAGMVRYSTQDGNFPTIREPLYACSRAAMAVRVLTYRPLRKKCCMVRLERLAEGRQTKPVTPTPPS